VNKAFRVANVALLDSLGQAVINQVHGIVDSIRQEADDGVKVAAERFGAAQHELLTLTELAHNVPRKARNEIRENGNPPTVALSDGVSRPRDWGHETGRGVLVNADENVSDYSHELFVSAGCNGGIAPENIVLLSRDYEDNLNLLSESYPMSLILAKVGPLRAWKLTM
jgi:hypothetical protein